MNLSLFVSTFVAVFLAELGDKTQVATLTISAGNRQPLTVFLASSAALVANAAIAVVAAATITKVVSPLWLARIAGTVLILMGAWTLWKAGR